AQTGAITHSYGRPPAYMPNTSWTHVTYARSYDRWLIHLRIPCMSATPAVRHADNGWSVFKVFLRLGLTSFGGPIAHLGYFRNEFVSRRQWLSERSFADLVALCQFLP